MDIEWTEVVEKCPFCRQDRTVRVPTRYPKVDVGARPEAEHRSAQTPQDWREGEQSDNLSTRATVVSPAVPMTGRVRNVRDRPRGFIFVEGDDGVARFCHKSSSRNVTFDTLMENDPVEFDALETDKGPRAINLKLL